jgi:hypothetical protein
MTAPQKTVFVPPTEPGAYNPDRAAGKLLKAQTVHLREALLRHLLELAAVLALDPGTLKTEGQVSAYIHRATALLPTRAHRAVRK